MYLTKHKIFILWPLVEKVVNPCPHKLQPSRTVGLAVGQLLRISLVGLTISADKISERESNGQSCGGW